VNGEVPPALPGRFAANGEVPVAPPRASQQLGTLPDIFAASAPAPAPALATSGRECRRSLSDRTVAGFPTKLEAGKRTEREHFGFQMLLDLRGNLKRRERVPLRRRRPSEVCLLEKLESGELPSNVCWFGGGRRFISSGGGLSSRGRRTSQRLRSDYRPCAAVGRVCRASSLRGCVCLGGTEAVRVSAVEGFAPGKIIPRPVSRALAVSPAPLPRAFRVKCAWARRASAPAVGAGECPVAFAGMAICGAPRMTWEALPRRAPIRRRRKSPMLQ
jgi:hypothetical protein